MALLSKTHKELSKAERQATLSEKRRNEDPLETERKRMAREKANERSKEKEMRYYNANRRSVAEWEAIGRLPPCPECGAQRCHF